MTTSEVDPRFDFGELRFHAETDIPGLTRRSVRWAVIVIVALGLGAFVLAGVPQKPGGGFSPVFVLAAPVGVVLLWGVGQALALTASWLKLGWTLDVYEDGLVESRFGRVRNALPFVGGRFRRLDRVFVSPRPSHGSGRFSMRHYQEDQVSAIHNAVHQAAERALAAAAVESLRSGEAITVVTARAHGTNHTATVTASGLRVDDGITHPFASLKVRLWSTHDGTRSPAGGPRTATSIEVFDGGESLAVIPLGSREGVLVRDVLLTLVEP